MVKEYMINVKDAFLGLLCSKKYAYFIGVCAGYSIGMSIYVYFIM